VPIFREVELIHCRGMNFAGRDCDEGAAILAI